MKISEITTEYLKNYLRLDDNSFNNEIGICLESAKAYVINHTGISAEHLDDYTDLTQAVIVLVSDFFENHLYQQGGAGAEIKVNKIIDTILDHHRVNLC